MGLRRTSTNYTMVSPPVRGDNSRALASGLSPVKADKAWYNYFIHRELAQYKIFRACVCNFL